MNNQDINHMQYKFSRLGWSVKYMFNNLISSYFTKVSNFTSCSMWLNKQLNVIFLYYKGNEDGRLQA